MKRKLAGTVLGVVIVICFWQVGSMLLNKSFLPTPGAAGAAFVEQLLSGNLTKHFLVSTYRVVTSILLAVLLGVPLGFLMGRSPKAAALLDPIVYLLYPLPKVVFLPIIVVLMGLGDGPKIFLITLVIFFQIAVVTRDAAKAIPSASIQSMQSLNASRVQMYQHLIIPYCLPEILTSLRITLGTAIAILFFAETFASFDGLGYFILEGMETRNYPEMYAGILALALLGLLLYAIVDLIENYFCRWQEKE